MQQARDNSSWGERSWAIFLIAERERASVTTSQGRKFPAIPRDRVGELFDAVQERACAPAGPDGTFPGGAYKHADLDHVPAFLAQALFNSLREHKRRRFDRTVADGDAVLAHLSSGADDLAEIVHTRHALDTIADEAGALADEVKAYMWADSEGVKRAEILARSGWSARRLRAVRREVEGFRARARVAAAAFLPLPLVQRLLGLRSGAAASAAGGLGGGAKALLACGAAATTAACGVGFAVLAEGPESPRPAPVAGAAAAPSPSPAPGGTRAPVATPTPRPAAAAASGRRRVRRRAPSLRAPESPVRTPPPARAATGAQVLPAGPRPVRTASSSDFHSEFSP